MASDAEKIYSIFLADIACPLTGMAPPQKPTLSYTLNETLSNSFRGEAADGTFQEGQGVAASVVPEADGYRPPTRKRVISGHHHEISRS
jgi:hypothetical protein